MLLLIQASHYFSSVAFHRPALIQPSARASSASPEPCQSTQNDQLRTFFKMASDRRSLLHKKQPGGNVTPRSYCDMCPDYRRRLSTVWSSAEYNMGITSTTWCHVQHVECGAEQRINIHVYMNCCLQRCS